MLINLYFGDYYDDGHGHYERVCIDAPNEGFIARALEFLDADYPHFFEQLAHDYMDASIGPEVEAALLKAEYPLERFLDMNDDNIYENFSSLQELFESEQWDSDGHLICSINFVADATIWMLNYYGAQATVVPPPPAPTFSFTAGYGLFE